MTDYHYTTRYRLRKGDFVAEFNSEREACSFLGVAKCSVASCYKRGTKCKGYTIERIGLTTHGQTKTRLHKIWESMHSRCEYEKHPHFSDYGGRGINVCTEWKDFVPFRDWALQNGYKENLTIDRKGSNGNYCPENCRWITMKQQQNNKRSNHCLTHNGETHTIAEWADLLGISKTTIKERLRLGWSVADVLVTPIRERKRGYRPSIGAKMDEVEQ